MIEIEKIIQEEIDWSKRHSGVTDERYEEGFIKGLQQALYLINQFKKDNGGENGNS